MAGMQALLEQLHPDAIAAREDDAARKRAIATAEQVISLLETPFERAWRICMIEVHQTTAI